MKLLTTLILAALTVTVQAATDSTTVYVTGTRTQETSVNTAASIRIITREEIIKSGASSVTEILRGQHGIHVYDLYGDATRATIDMRGFSSTAVSNIVVLIDGQKLNSTTDSSTLSFNSVSINDIDRIEIVHGSSGVLFGDQAVGGVINIITNTNKSKDSAMMQVKTGSWGRSSKSASATKTLNDKISVSFIANQDRSDGYRDHNSSETNNWSFSAGYIDNFTTLNISHKNFDEYVENPGSLFLSELASDRTQSALVYSTDFTKTKTNTTTVNFSKDLNPNWTIQTDLSNKSDDVAFRLSSRSGTRTQIDTQTRENFSINPRLQGRYSIPDGDIKLTIGGDFAKSDYTIHALKPQISDQKIQSIFGQISYPLSQNLDFALGTRYAEVKNHIEHAAPSATDYTVLNPDDKITVGTLGITYTPSSSIKMFARADQNYRFATLEEHTGDYYANNISPYIPQGLKNQTGISYESGFELTSKSRTFLIQGYQLELNNEISYSSTQYANVNIEKTKRKGVNIVYTEYLTDSLKIIADLDFTDGKITGGDDAGNLIPMVPKKQARISAIWNPSDAISMGGDYLYISEQVLDSDFSNSSPKLASYSVSNLFATYKINNWTLNTRINNLFNKKYSEIGSASWAGDAYNPAPERNFWAGVSYRFN